MSSTLREEGNAFYKSGKLQEALECYEKALESASASGDIAVLHKNKAACYLKMEQYKMAEISASQCEYVAER